MEDTLKNRLVTVVALATDYCVALENAREAEKNEFVVEILNYLPRLYWEFSDLQPEAEDPLDDEEYYPSYITEEYYDSIRRGVESILGPDDTYLETFEEDMKYSDTPIGASISEGLADIFQALYNFVSIVRESQGENMIGAYRECRDNFVGYWSQTLCNVMRALNYIRFK